MSSSSQSPSDKTYPSKVWWLFAVMIFFGCILAQLPISWIVQKYMPNTPYIQWVSGSLFQGSATWQLPNPNSADMPNNVSSNSGISGSLNWQLKPLKLLMGKVSADVDLSLGQSHLEGEVNTNIIGLFSDTHKWQAQSISGKIHQSTLTEVLAWQFPDAPIQVNNLSMSYDKESGFSKTEGQLTWVGGQFGYPNAGQVIQINLPPMVANLNSDKGVLNINLINQQDKALGNFKISQDGMLDVNLMQRLLESMPSYTGSAPKDTAVVSIRQPLNSLGK